MTGPALAGLALAIALGAGYGFVAQRGAFCLSSGFRTVATKRDFTKVKAYGLAVALQMLALPVVLWLGASRPTVLPFSPLAAALGGLLFGASMRFAGGCAAGVWFKLGGSSATAAASVVGMALGAAALEVGPLSGVREAVQAVGANATPNAVPAWLAPVLGVALLAMFARAKPGRAGAWSWQKTGLALGVLGVLAWPASSLAGRHFGMAVVPGTVELVAGPLGASLGARWDLLFVVGIPVGAFFAVRLARRSSRTTPAPKRVAQPITSAALARSLVGGLGLGVGASLAAGCTVGHGLTGVPLLAPASLLAMGCIFVGATLPALLEARRASTAVTSGTSAA